MSALIRLERVCRTYPLGSKGVQALRDVSLRIEPGEFVAILGASGSGKSTLMNILGCLDRPSKGSYFLQDLDVSALDRDELAEIRSGKMGFVFQNFNLLSRTSALQNVLLPTLYSTARRSDKERRELAVRALQQVGLADRLDHLPNQLSGGEQQRVAIARALINQPAVLLADEPTGNLDSRTSAEVMAIFQSLNQRGITIIMVTHEPDIARHAKRNVTMRDGCILSDLPVVRQPDSRFEAQRWEPAHTAATLSL